MIEKRNSERTKVALNAFFHNERSETFPTRIRNISMSGMFMETPRFIRQGTKISVDIDAENLGRVLGVYGQVVRSTDTGVGLEFTSINGHDLDMLIEREKFIASKKKRASGTSSRR